MKKIVIIILLLMISGIGYAGYKYYAKQQAQKQFADDEMATVIIGDVEAVVTAEGTLEPKEYVDVGAQVSGLIKKLYFELGDAVKAGDQIAQIDDDIYKAAVKEDEARLKTLSAQKAEQEANLKFAQQKFDRNKKLLKDKAVSKEVFEDADNALKVANAKLASIDAQIEEAQSALERDITNLGYTKIFAPISGTIVLQPVNEGQTINANQTAPVIEQVAQLDIMTVKAQVAEADIMKIKEGMDMYFTTLGSDERRWHGNVRQILPSPETENNVVLYNVLVDVDNKDGSLMVGMTAQMFFVLDTAKNVPIIPKNALIKRLPSKDTDKGDAYTVRVVGKNNTADEREVIVSVSDRVNIAVVSGLKENEKVLVGDAAKKYGLESKSGFPRGGMGRL